MGALVVHKTFAGKYSYALEVRLVKPGLHILSINTKSGKAKNRSVIIQ